MDKILLIYHPVYFLQRPPRYLQLPCLLKSSVSIISSTSGQRTTDAKLFNFDKVQMANHSSVLAWRIPGMGEPGGLLSVGSHSRTRLKRFSSSSSSLFFLLLPVSSVSYPRNHCQIQCHEAFPLFSSKNIIVLGFMCRSLIHFELIFVFGVSKGLTFVHVDNNFPNTIF